MTDRTTNPYRETLLGKRWGGRSNNRSVLGISHGNNRQRVSKYVIKHAQPAPPRPSSPAERRRCVKFDTTSRTLTGPSLVFCSSFYSLFLIIRSACSPLPRHDFEELTKWASFSAYSKHLIHWAGAIGGRRENLHEGSSSSLFSLSLSLTLPSEMAQFLARPHSLRLHLQPVVIMS